MSRPARFVDPLILALVGGLALLALALLLNSTLPPARTRPQSQMLLQKYND